MQLRECRQASLVDPGLNVAIADALEINHGRGDVAVSHPLLKRADVDAVLQVPRGVGVAEFVQEPPAAEGSFGAAVDRPVPSSSTWHSAMAAVQLAALGDGLEFFQHGAVGPAGGAREHRIVRGPSRGGISAAGRSVSAGPGLPAPPSSSDEIPSAVSR